MHMQRRYEIVGGIWVLLLLLVACSEPRSRDLVRASEPGYTRIERCAACHTDSYAEWQRSLHSRAMTVPSDSTVVGNFDNAKHTYGGVTSRMFRRGDEYYMETQGPDGDMQTYRVDYTIGVRQHQAYITRFPDGRYQVLPLYHNGPTDSWVDAQEGGVVEQAHPLRRGDYYFWANAGRSWNFHCFDCHASRVEKGYDIETDTYRSSVGALPIDCEACHGPSEKHDATRGQLGEPMHLVDLLRLDKAQSVEVCAQCHAAKEIVAKGYLPGENFYDYYQLVLPDDKAIFYPDGQPRVYLYPTALHMMGTCFAKGDLRCTSCHDSHGTAREADLVADRDGVGLCEKCHADIAADPVAHGHHKPGSAGNQCAPCHMPYHYVTGEHLTDHRIQSPAPKNTVENGVPNACNQSGCHADQSAIWASHWAEKWYGNYQDEVVARTSAVALAQKGSREAVVPLIDMLNHTSAVWRGTAASLLGDLGDMRAVLPLIGAMEDAHPMVRLKATVALGHLGDVRGLPALLGALSDSARIVRIQAPFALMDVGYFPDASARGDAFRAALDELRAVVRGVQGDDPGFHDSLGELYERQGRFDDAAREFGIVARLDPEHPETAADLARLKEEKHQFDILLAALTGDESPQAQARLGALLLRNGRYAEAAQALEKAAETLNAVSVFSALGDAYWGGGDRDGAQRAYARAIAVQPDYRPTARRLAQLAFSSGDVADSEAFDSFEEGPADGFVTRAVAASTTGDWAAARYAFVAALDAESRGDRTFGLGPAAQRDVQNRADSIFAVGGAAFERNAFKPALAAYVQTAELNPERADVHAMQGLLRAELGESERAEAHLIDALMVDPGYVPAMTIWGTIYQERNQAQTALNLYRQAWALDPWAPGLEPLMGETYMMLGQRDSARAVLSRVVKREPENAQARTLLNRAGGPE